MWTYRYKEKIKASFVFMLILYYTVPTTMTSRKKLFKTLLKREKYAGSITNKGENAQNQFFVFSPHNIFYSCKSII